jgi:uncharacterized protein YidB (DUF937 family)
MGLLDILNGMQNGPRGQTQPGKGGMSPITMAILALLAYKAYGKMTGNKQPQTAPAGRVPANEADGGLGGLLGGLLGGGGRAGGVPAGGGLGGALGGLLGGAAAGGLLNGGLKDLLNSFEQQGQGDVAGSWVGKGPNQQISPTDLSKVLGDDTVNSLAEQAGLSRIELLNGMSRELPQFVDQLTPDGRLPTDQEMSQIL